jgi:uncharacterized protein
MSAPTESIPVLSHFQADVLLEARGRGEGSVDVSVDLGLTVTTASLDEQGVRLSAGPWLSWGDVEHIAEEKAKCFLVESEGIRAIQVFSEETNWMRSLMATEGAPTTLVGGFPMHRIKDTDPLEDTRAKIKAIRPVTGRVLDTATGLGYTAIQAAETASEVVTVELDPAALEIARLNPWSRPLFQRENIRITIGDVYDEVERFEDSAFDRVIHDPPTLSLAGDLYSEAFYRQLYRVLGRRGRLFHYIGDPEGRTGRRTTDGVIQRLRAAGFERVDRRPKAYGVVAYR